MILKRACVHNFEDILAGKLQPPSAGENRPRYTQTQKFKGRKAGAEVSPTLASRPSPCLDQLAETAQLGIQDPVPAQPGRNPGGPRSGPRPTTAWDRRVHPSGSPPPPCRPLGPPCLPPTCPRHPALAAAPVPPQLSSSSHFSGWPRAGSVMMSPPSHSAAGASGPSAAAPPATWLHMADGRAAGHVLGMGWRAGCLQGLSLCPEAPHLAAGTASGWGLDLVEGTVSPQFQSGSTSPSQKSGPQRPCWGRGLSKGVGVLLPGWRLHTGKPPVLRVLFSHPQPWEPPTCPQDSALAHPEDGSIDQGPPEASVQGEVQSKGHARGRQRPGRGC